MPLSHGPSVDTRLPLPFPWSLPKEKKSAYFRFKRDSKTAQVKKHLFRVQKTKPNITLVLVLLLSTLSFSIFV